MFVYTNVKKEKLLSTESLPVAVGKLFEQKNPSNALRMMFQNYIIASYVVE